MPKTKDVNPCEAEYLKLQTKLGWKKTDAAIFFEVDVTTVRRWCTDKIPASRAVILCMRSLISKRPVKPPKFT